VTNLPWRPAAFEWVSPVGAEESNQTRRYWAPLIVAKLGEQFYTDATGQMSASFPNQSRGAMKGYHARFATLPR
jgi:hypothetical protein